MPQRNVATNFTFEQQRAEINLIAADFWSQKTLVDGAASTYLKHDGSNAYTGATLAVPNAFTINSDTGNGTVTIAGNLQVNGTTTTVNTATMDVVDKNITIAKGSANDAAADGAGITIDSATDITWNFVDAKNAWVSSIGVESTTFLKAGQSLEVNGLSSLQGAQFSGAAGASTGSGVDITAPDANTGQISAYNHGTTTYNPLNIKSASAKFYTGTTNALAATFNNAGLIMESGKTVTGNVTGNLTGNADTATTAGTVTTAAQPNITSVGTLTGLDLGDNNITNVGEISLDKIKPDNANVMINMGTDKNVSFSGGIGEIDNVTGFQTSNDAGSANTAFGIRANDIRFATGSAERVRITDTGVGIGTNNPGQLLEINGGSSPCVLVKDTTNNVISYLFADDSNAFVGSASNHPVIIKQNNGTALTIDTNKNATLVGSLTIGAVAGTNTNSFLPVLFQTAAGVIEGGSGLTYNPGGDSLAVNGLTISQGGINGNAGSMQLSCANHSSNCKITITNVITTKANIEPEADNADNLGSATKRWANVYTADLQMNNTGTGGNEVDGSEGRWTMQEGSDDLFLINRNTGKKYKFNLTEVS